MWLRYLQQLSVKILQSQKSRPEYFLTTFNFPGLFPDPVMLSQSLSNHTDHPNKKNGTGIIPYKDEPLPGRSVSHLVSSLPDAEGTLKKWLSVRLRVTRAFHARPVCVSRHPRPTAHATRCTSAESDYTEWRRTPARGGRGVGGCDMDGQRGSRDTRSPPKVAHAKKSRASPEKPGAARPLVTLSKGKLPAAERYICFCTSTCFWGAIHGASEELESPPVVPLYRCQLSPLKGKYLLLEKVCLLRKRSYRIRKE